MLTKKEIIKKLEEKKNLLTEKYSVKKIGLFGSCVHDSAGPESDIDFLVEFTRLSFDNYMELKFYLEGIFNGPVDLVMADTLKERLKPIVMQEVVYA